MPLTRNLAERYRFDAEILEVIISARSAIDGIDSLGMRTLEEATNFLECYGFDLSDPIEKAELFGHYQEALNFIRQTFLFPQNPDGLKIEMPRKLMELSDPVMLLLMASAQGQSGAQAQLANWACAIIKVMHTISHLDRDVRTSYYSDIQTQVLDRFYKHIHNEEGRLFLGKDSRDPDLVGLVAFQTKPKKSRESMILKMLHKPENVAEDIFDRVGIRFITKTRFDALRLIKYLRDRYIIMPANSKPSRSRNSLINVAQFKEALDKVLVDLEQGTITPAQADARLVEACAVPESAENRDNPYSSKEYASLQFTGRQLIKIKNPLFSHVKELKSLSEDALSPAARDAIAKIDFKNIQKEIRFFYPFEVQLYDEVSHLKNLEGENAHSAYKKNQVQAALKRVMGGLVGGL